MSVYHHDNARMARKFLGFVLIVVGVCLMSVLYYVKIRAQSAKSHTVRLHSQIEREILAINVLRAEIAHLESPERLNYLAKEYTQLVPTSAEHVIQVSDIDRLFPLITPKGVVSEGGTP